MTTYCIKPTVLLFFNEYDLKDISESWRLVSITPDQPIKEQMSIANDWISSVLSLSPRVRERVMKALEGATTTNEWLATVENTVAPNLSHLERTYE